MKLFSKEDSRFLTTANALLLGQIGVGIAYFLIILGQMIFSDASFKVESAEWIRILVTILVGAGILSILNRNPKVFKLDLPRAEKIFGLISLGVFDVAFCTAVSYILILPFQSSDLSEKAVFHSIGSASVIAVVFLVLMLVVPRMQLFRREGSGRFNAAILGLVFGLGIGLSGFFSTLIEGPNGSSEIIQAAFLGKVSKYGIMSIAMIIGLAVLRLRTKIVRFARRMSIKVRHLNNKAKLSNSRPLVKSGRKS